MRRGSPDSGTAWHRCIVCQEDANDFLLCIFSQCLLFVSQAPGATLAVNRLPRRRALAHHRTSVYHARLLRPARARCAAYERGEFGMVPGTGDQHEVPEWARGDPLMEWYSTQVWGKRAPDDDALFEVMCLQVFQAGLTWRMILARRDAFRAAFNDWRIDDVAEMGSGSIERLVKDPSIIRNRRKIEACVTNAGVIQRIREQHGSFCRWFYDVIPGDDLPSIQRTLRSTFAFMGPEIARMWLGASGRIEL